jgi:DNA repair protein RecN (Recombination protein N)
MHREQIISAMQACDQLIASEDGADILVNRALGQLERLADKTGQDLSAITAPLDRAAAELEEARSSLEDLSADIDFDATTQSEIDNRLFKLRSIARKHNVETDELPDLLDDLRNRLNAIDDRGDSLMDLAKREQAAEREYEKLADQLHDERHDSAEQIENAIHPELSDLKLENATFQVSITTMGRDRWGPHGKDGIEFLIATNPGMTPGPIQKIASGGELARLMLALKVVLAGAASAPTLIFDEVDAGVGGAVADAVGRRLHTLGQQIQVLVVTHSPQVAARADHHWQIAKTSDAGRARTTIQAIDQSDRLEEIARMLAGQSVTDEARAAAKKLITADG